MAPSPRGRPGERPAPSDRPAEHGAVVAAPELDIRGNPTVESTGDLVAHPPPRSPCKPLPLRRWVTLDGTISRRGEGFVPPFAPPGCGPDEPSLDVVDLEPANAKVDLAKFDSSSSNAARNSRAASMRRRSASRSRTARVT